MSPAQRQQGSARAAMLADGKALIERVRQLPGGRALLRLSAPRDDVELVGGAVRDLMLGLRPAELDVALDGAASPFGTAAARFVRELELELLCEQPSLAGHTQICVHERFGTAALRWPGFGVDVAARRCESYPHPGALPVVAPGSREQDLRRRDFTVNAIALELSAASLGRVRGADDALKDLAARRLRVLHEASFRDDPSRLWRLGRYAGRLGFEVHEGTANLACAAIESGALQTISAARTGAEVRLASAEHDQVAVISALQELGVLAAVDERLIFDPALLRRALRLLPADGHEDLLTIAVLLLALPIEEVARLLDLWEYPLSERRPVIEAVERASALAEGIAAANRASQLWDLLAERSVEAVALAGALRGERGAAAAQRWLTELRHIRLRITGDDLLSAGLSPGPQVGLALSAVMRQRLDRTIPEGREAELAAALRQRA